MLFALDYDGTYTASPELWDIFILKATEAGHLVICCTMRYKETEGQEVIDALNDKVHNIIFTERQAKREYLMNLGIHPNVWIDDNPHWIFMNSN